jgi:hypothetical protein
MVTEGGVRKADPKPSDRVRSRSIYFDGSGDYASMATSSGILDLSPYDKVTVEVCFKETNVDRTEFLFEYSKFWNINDTGFGVFLNSGSTTHVHTNFRNREVTASHSVTNRPIDYIWANQDNVFTTHTNYYNLSKDGTSRLVWIDGTKGVFVEVGKENEVANVPQFDVGNGNFIPQPFYLANRGNHIDVGNYNSAFQGEIASVRIYGRKLTDSEIQRNAEADRRRFSD